MMAALGSRGHTAAPRPCPDCKVCIANRGTPGLRAYSNLAACGRCLHSSCPGAR